jgi:molecular chaperone Hsp33
LLDDLRGRLRAGALTRALAAPSPPVDAEALARAALGDAAADLTVLDVRPVRFFCPCSRERAAATLALFSPEELTAMAVEDDGAVVTCEFCRARHELTRQEVERIRDEKLASA